MVLDDTGEGLIVEHEGDIVLHARIFGKPFVKVCSYKGNVHMSMSDVEIREISAPQGEIVVKGNLKSDVVTGLGVTVNGNLHAREARCSGLQVDGFVKAECVRAESSGVRVGGDMIVSEELVVSDGDLTVEGALESTAGCVSVVTGSIAVSGRAQLKNVETGKDAHFGGELKATEVRVGHKLLVGGAVEAHALRASVVHLRGPTVAVRVIQGQSQIHIGPSHVNSNIVIAPSVNVDQKMTGCVKCLESQESLESLPPAVKGCLQLQDLADLIGQEQVDRLLGSNSLSRLDSAVRPTSSEINACADADTADDLPRTDARRRSDAGGTMRHVLAAAASAVGDGGGHVGNNRAEAAEEDPVTDLGGERRRTRQSLMETPRHDKARVSSSNVSENLAAASPAPAEAEAEAEAGAKVEAEAKAEAPAEAESEAATEEAAAPVAAEEAAAVEKDGSGDGQDDDVEAARQEARRLRKERRSLRSSLKGEALDALAAA